MKIRRGKVASHPRRTIKRRVNRENKENEMNGLRRYLQGLNTSKQTQIKIKNVFKFRAGTAEKWRKESTHRSTNVKKKGNSQKQRRKDRTTGHIKINRKINHYLSRITRKSNTRSGKQEIARLAADICLKDAFYADLMYKVSKTKRKPILNRKCKRRMKGKNKKRRSDFLKELNSKSIFFKKAKGKIYNFVE